MSKRPLALAAILLLVTLACKPPFCTSVTAYAGQDAARLKHYMLVGPDPAKPGGDPQWPAFAKMLTRALEAQGYVADQTAPELILRVSYRAGDTRVYTETVTKTDENGLTSSSASSTTSALYVIQVEAITSDSWAARKPLVLWRTHGTLRNSADDMGRVFPYMVSAMESYFAKTLSSPVDIIKYSNAPEAMRLMK